MPSTSVKQAHLMSALAHGWKPPKGSKVAKIPLSVAEDFHSADAGHKYGKGHDKKRADGGAALNLAYAIKRAEGGKVHVGPIVSTVPGRTDHHPMDVASGSYVLPAEFVSHMGESNTLAGLEKIKQLGPHGLRKMAHAAHGASAIKAKHKASGGAVEQSLGRPIPINAAGGEHVMSPDDVGIVGDGDVKLGHKLLDNLVMQRRKGHLETLRKLKPPAKD